MTPRMWLAVLLAFLRPAVAGDQQVDDKAGDAAGDKGGDADQGGGEDQLDLDLQGQGDQQSGDQQDDQQDDQQADQKDDAAAELAKEREARQKAEREAAELRIAQSRSGQRTPEQEQYAREEERLKASDITPLERWQIESSRTMRQNTTAAQFALRQAQDLSDRTEFRSLFVTDPTAKKYEVRVEEELAKARAAGQNPSREAIYTYMLGQDMRKGTLKRAAQKPAQKPAQRQLPPGARSDVPGKGGGGLSKKDALAKKLENVRI